VIHSTNFKKILLVIVLLSLGVKTINAASFYFDPSIDTFTDCRNTIALMIDVTGEESNSADIEIFYDPSKIEIIDADSSLSGIQIREGNAYNRYWGNITFSNSGQIFLGGGSLPINTNTLDEERVFGYIDFNFIGESGDSTSLEIRMDSIGNTLDSNIASSIDGSDLLTDKIDGTYTFDTPRNCREKKRKTVPTEAPQEDSPIGEDSSTDEDIEKDESTTESYLPSVGQNRSLFSRFSNPKIADSIVIVQEGIHISKSWLMLCISIQLVFIPLLLVRRKKIQHAIIKKEILIKATSRIMRREKISYNKILNLK
jgi:hypothetical protein